MCFSTTASLTTAAILIPSGLYCINSAKQLDKSYWAIAMLPFIFGLQQLLEGGVWFSLENGNTSDAHILSLGFVLFSHLFWLGWVGFSSYLVESSESYKFIFKWFAITGILFGASMYLPLLIYPHWLTTTIINYSIYYNFNFIFDPYISKTMLALIYSGFVILPLFLSSNRYLNILGIMIFVSGLFSWEVYNSVFVSVWCYFAAIISLYIFYVISFRINSLQDSAKIKFK